MSTENLSAEERTDRRAQWESFEFCVPIDGKVNVSNLSYGADEARDHTYTVTVTNGSAAECTCPADEHRAGACKHRVAVDRNAAVLAAATPEVRAEISGPHTERNRFGRKTGTFHRCEACDVEALTESAVRRHCSCGSSR